MDLATIPSWNDYVGLLQAGRWEEVDAIARSVLASNTEADVVEPQGEVVRFVCGFAEASEEVGSFAQGVLWEYTKRFPNSLHPAWVFSGLIAYRQGRFDLATEHARNYLFLAKSRALDTMVEDGVIQRFATRAFLLATAAYTELGARSRSLLILEEACRYRLHPGWRGGIDTEITQLRSELSDPGIRAVDTAWEQFFQTGRLDDHLAQRVFAGDFPEFAKRIDLLEGYFRFGAIQSVPVDELYALVAETEAGQQLFGVPHASSLPGVTMSLIPGLAPTASQGSAAQKTPVADATMGQDQSARRWFRRRK